MVFYRLLFIACLADFCSFAQIPLEKMPIPPTLAGRLFYVQRSSNTNTIVYDANMLINKSIDSKNPVNVYWIRYGEKGQREPLNYLQRTLAYGVECAPIANEPGNYDVRLVAYKKRRIKVTANANGVPVALIVINGKWQQLLKVYALIEETGNLIPKVKYIELFGRDLKTGLDVYERFKP
jgi:Domain of unknown function (DUF4833)